MEDNTGRAIIKIVPNTLTQVIEIPLSLLSASKIGATVPIAEDPHTAFPAPISKENFFPKPNFLLII